MLHFFLGRVYVSGTWYHFSLLQRSTKQWAKCLKRWNGSEMVTKILRPFYSNILRLWDNDEEFLNRVFCILLPGEFAKMLYNSRFSDIHSSPKETQLSNLLEASSFVKSQQGLLLRCLMTVRERWGILEWGFWQIGTRTIEKMTCGPNFTYLHSSPQKRQLQKSWVFWGEECTLYMFDADHQCQSMLNISSDGWCWSAMPVDADQQYWSPMPINVDYPCWAMLIINAGRCWSSMWTNIDHQCRAIPIYADQCWWWILSLCKGGPAPFDSFLLPPWIIFLVLPKIVLPKSNLVSPCCLGNCEFAQCIKIGPDVYNWCICVLKCRANEKPFRYKTAWFYGTPYAPCSLNYFLLLPAPWSFLHPAPGSLDVLAPILLAP